MIKSFILTAATALLPTLTCLAQEAGTPTTGLDVSIPVYDKVVFYDGYQPIIIDAEVEDGILRHSNSLYSIRLTDEQLDKVGSKVGLNITIGALCDEYDRIGSINIAFVPKGSESYSYEDVERVEIARFITPFMDKNKEPNQVPYDYILPGVELILRDKALREKYDYWMEFDLFGVPYSANNLIQGCKDRNDVFQGTVTFLTDNKKDENSSGHILIPVYTRRQEHYGSVNLNNYNENATDTLGTTTRTFEINLPKDVEDSKITFILTNHGAQRGGEEYVRRLHLVYFNGDLAMAYTPGGVSCEPYRKYNTCNNGIYGFGTKPTSYWESVSNWCPGQAVPIREIHTGPLKAGVHKFMIRVPDAKFVNSDGDFRPSIYFQGVEKGNIALTVTDIMAEEAADITLTMEGNTVVFSGTDTVASLSIFSTDGRMLYGKGRPGESFDLSFLGAGVYAVVVTTPEGRTAFAKVAVR